MINMKYCRTENVISAIKEWYDDPGSDEGLHETLVQFCAEIADNAGYVKSNVLHDRIENLEARLREIAEYAHEKSTGLAVPDALWNIREMAYEPI